MPCPLFEPRCRVSEPATGRLPLLFEFAGVCHANDAAADSAHHFRYCNLQYCNQGYAKGNCASFPPGNSVSALRFSVTRRSESSLQVRVVEEEDYWPRAWSTVDFMINESRLVPEIEDVCRRAQVFQFCLAYLDKF